MSAATSSTNNTHNHHHPHSTTTTATHRSQPTTQACAACKYQRRKCNPDCTLAPYFPADQQRQFLNAHRLFGVSNILKIIRNLDPVQRGEAMRSIIFQSNTRAHDPVGGCYRLIADLERQYERDSQELAAVLRYLAFYRAQAQDLSASAPVVHPTPNPPFLNDGDDAIYASNHHTNLDTIIMQQQQQQCYNYFYDGPGGDDLNNNNNNDNSSNSNSNSNSINNYNKNNNGIEMEVPLSMLSLQQQCEDVTDVKPLVDMFEDRPEFTVVDGEEESKDAVGPFHCILGNKMEEKEDENLMEHVQEHDLKEAASMFTLTNCNMSSI